MQQNAKGIATYLYIGQTGKTFHFCFLSFGQNLQDEPVDKPIAVAGAMVAKDTEGDAVGPNMSRRHVYSRGYHAAEKVGLAQGREDANLKLFCREAAKAALKKADFS